VARYLKGKDGKLAGSIGDGKHKTPTSMPAAPAAHPDLPERTNNPVAEAFRKYLATQPAGARITLIDTCENEVDITAGQLDEDAIYIFTNGHCHSFALAAHEATGLPMMGLQPVVDPDTDPDDLWDPNSKYMNHIVLHLDEETYLDAEGIHRYEDAITYEFIPIADKNELEHLIYSINVKAEETVWTYPKPHYAEPFITPALQKYAPQLIR
jgi:hypothetical protein